MASLASAISCGWSHGLSEHGFPAPSHFCHTVTEEKIEQSGVCWLPSQAQGSPGLLQVKKDTELPWCRNKPGRPGLAQSLYTWLIRHWNGGLKGKWRPPILWRSSNTGENPQLLTASGDRMMDGFVCEHAICLRLFIQSAGRQMLIGPRVHRFFS